MSLITSLHTASKDATVAVCGTRQFRAFGRPFGAKVFLWTISRALRLHLHLIPFILMLTREREKRFLLSVKMNIDLTEIQLM